MGEYSVTVIHLVRGVGRLAIGTSAFFFLFSFCRFFLALLFIGKGF